MSLRNYFEQMIAMRKEMNKRVRQPEGVRFSCFEELVLTYGQPYQHRPRPDEFPKGTPKQCYANSAELVLEYDDLVYVEGYGVVKDVGIPILHAWCVLAGSTDVIDVTSDNIDDYFGIAFSTEYVEERWANANNTALIDCWEDEYPLMFASDERMKEIVWAPAT